MIEIMHRYPSYDVCIICNGERSGECAGYDCGSIVSSPVSSLAVEYTDWLDENLPPFELAKSLIDSGADIVEIIEQFLGKKVGRRTFVTRRSCLSLVSSYLDIDFDGNDDRANRTDHLDPELQIHFDKAIIEFRSD